MKAGSRPTQRRLKTPCDLALESLQCLWCHILLDTVKSQTHPESTTWSRELPYPPSSRQEKSQTLGDPLLLSCHRLPTVNLKFGLRFFPKSHPSGCFSFAQWCHHYFSLPALKSQPPRLLCPVLWFPAFWMPFIIAAPTRPRVPLTQNPECTLLSLPAQCLYRENSVCILISQSHQILKGPGTPIKLSNRMFRAAAPKRPLSWGVG